MQVELLKRTPFGGAGDIVEVEENIFLAYGQENMKSLEEMTQKKVITSKDTKKKNA